MTSKLTAILSLALLVACVRGPLSGPHTPSSAILAAPSGPSPRLPDTGQTRDYSPVFGEDSDYAINAPAYTDPADGTIADDVTGLVWQRADGGEMTWAGAVAYCDDLVLGGASDWRLPSSHESFDLLDHDRQNPPLDPRYFAATQAQYWWTANEMAGDPDRAWSVNAGGGIGPHPKAETVSAGGVKRFHARCVRGALQTSPVLGGDDVGTVTDRATGLDWQPSSSGPIAWEAALGSCEGLILAAHDDWRLPNIKELRSISDDARSRPSVDATFFPDTASDPYWSSTSNTYNGAEAWSVTFESGLVSHDAKSGAERVRCVRGGPTAGATTFLPFASVPGTTRR
jgi:hypothetical protein